MIKVKRTSSYYYDLFGLIIIGLFCILLFTAFIDLIFKREFKLNKIIFFGLPLIAYLIALRSFYLNSFRIYWEENLGKVKFKGNISFKSRIYAIQEFDGYVSSRFIKDRRNLTRVLWLVKDGLLVERINEKYVLNIYEFEDELKKIKYLGYEQFTFLRRIKLLFWTLKLSL